jgi:hypothetical protein
MQTSGSVMPWRRAVGVGGLALLVMGSSVAAHSGGLNAQGCHNNRKTGDYHCHRASSGGSGVADDSPPVKLSRSGICHVRGTNYYANTKRFRAFPSIDACLAAGGRRPKR